VVPKGDSNPHEGTPTTPTPQRPQNLLSGAERYLEQQRKRDTNRLQWKCSKLDDLKPVGIRIVNQLYNGKMTPAVANSIVYTLNFMAKIFVLAELEGEVNRLEKALIAKGKLPLPPPNDEEEVFDVDD
jgi:hypothetical protein